MHSQHNLLLVGAVAIVHRPFPEERVGVVLPLTILNLMMLGPVSTLQVGCCVVCIDRIDPVGLATWIRDERVSNLSAVPTMIHDLLTHPDVAPTDLASLARPGCGGGATPESFRRLYEERFGIRLTIGYGLTEAPTAVTVEDPELPRVPDGSGRALPHVSVTVRADDGAELAAGAVGEVCVGPADDGLFAGVYTPMLGYWNRPDATAEALRDGVLHTGDLGYLTADGDLVITDRKGRPDRPRWRQRVPRRGRTRVARGTRVWRRARSSAYPTNDSANGSSPRSSSRARRASPPRTSATTAPARWRATRCPSASCSSTSSRATRWARSSSAWSSPGSTDYVAAVTADTRASDQAFLGLVVDGDHDASVEVVPKLLSPRGSFYGGAGLAIACAMMELATQRFTTWCTVQFVSGAARGDRLDFHTDVVVHGHRTSQVRVTARTEGREVFTAVGATGAASGKVSGTFASMPAVSAPDDCARADWPSPEHAADTHFGSTEIREAVVRGATEGNRAPSMALWARVAGQPPWTPALLSYVADVVPMSIHRGSGRACRAG